MKAPELFGLVLRVLGLVLLVDALPKLVTGVVDYGDTGFWYLVRKLAGVAFGIWFLRGARPVQEQAYPGSQGI